MARLVCENHPTKAWPNECDCGPGMNDPVPAMALAIAWNLGFDATTLRVIPSTIDDAARAALEAYRKAVSASDVDGDQ